MKCCSQIIETFSKDCCIKNVDNILDDVIKDSVGKKWSFLNFMPVQGSRKKAVLI